MPVSFVWFGLTAVVYILQLIPWTGIFLMMLAAPFWSVVTVNLGFVSLGVEAILGRIDRAWLLAPLAWFGGYTAAAWLSHAEFARLDADVRRSNAAKSVPFSPEGNALVIDDERSGTLSGVATALVSRYGLPVAYETNKNSKTASHLAHRIAGKARCVELRSPAYRSAGIYATGMHEGRKFLKDRCRYSAPEDPVLPVVRVSATKSRHHAALLPYEQTIVQIDAGGGEPVRLTSGSAAPLSWWPKPIMGCALNSGAPSWQCFMGFGREAVRGLGGEGGYGGASIEVVANALGLSKPPAGMGPPPDDSSTATRLEQTVTQSIDGATAMLDRIVADPTVKATVHDVPGLRDRPDLLAPRADAMVAAVARALDGGSRTREVGRILQSFLAMLPPDDFQRVGPRLLADLAARPHIDHNHIAAELAARLGNLGEPAIGVLEKLAFSSGRREFAAAIYGLCRVGAPAASLADKVATLLVKNKRNHGEIHAAAYLALLRMGRPDLADADPDADAYYARKHYGAWRATVTPESPPSVCASSHGWPKLPDVKS